MGAYEYVVREGPGAALAKLPDLVPELRVLLVFDVARQSLPVDVTDVEFERGGGHQPVFAAPFHTLASAARRHVGVARGVDHRLGGKGAEAALVERNHMGDSVPIGQNVDRLREQQHVDAGRFHLLIEQPGNAVRIEGHAVDEPIEPAERVVFLGGIEPWEQGISA